MSDLSDHTDNVTPLRPGQGPAEPARPEASTDPLYVSRLMGAAKAEADAVADATTAAIFCPPSDRQRHLDRAVRVGAQLEATLRELAALKPDA